MDVSRLEREELVALLGGVLLALSVFLTWYTTGNQFARVYGRQGHLSAWEVLSVLRWLLLAAALAPLVLAWIIARGHALSWPRGEMTAVVAIVATVLVLIRGLIVKPGSPTGQIHLGVGWYLALVGCLLMLGGAAFHRARQDTGPRKPPGVL